MTRIAAIMLGVTILLLTGIYGQMTTGIIGYDCTAPDINMTSISLTTVDSCFLEDEDPIISEQRIQLIQVASHSNLQVYKCKIILKRDMVYCGMHSHISAINNGYKNYILDISSEDCMDIHKRKSVDVGDYNPNRELKLNSTTTGKVIIVGSLNDRAGL